MKFFSNRSDFFTKLYFIGIGLMIFALPLSKFLMSFAQLILIISWVGQGNLKEKFKAFFHNKPALVFSSIYLLHLLGLFYTCNMAYAFEDLKIKIPILIFPLIFSTSPVPSKELFNKYLNIFIFAVVFSTVCSILVLLDIIHRDIRDIRNISIFISHIRLSLLICMSILILFFRIFKDKITKLKLIAQGLLIFWLFYFLIIIESITGIGILFIVGIILLLYYSMKIKNATNKIAILGTLMVFIIIPLLFLGAEINSFYKEKSSAKEVIKTETQKGNPYTQILENKSIENSTYIWRNIEWNELRNSWNARSKYPFDSLDFKGQEIKYTIISVLSSKGLDKDEAAINALTNDEVLSIENGICNYKYQLPFSIKSRIHKIIWEYENYKETKNPNGHSVMLRAEFWKASINIIKSNFLIGVGTGDINKSFELEYKRMNSPLIKRYQLKSHNQYLRITVLFGILGLVWFIIVLIYPFFNYKQIHYFYFIFFLIAVLSMLSEDTIETQAGVSFYAFFNSFFYFLYHKTQYPKKATKVIQ